MARSSWIILAAVLMASSLVTAALGSAPAPPPLREQLQIVDSVAHIKVEEVTLPKRGPGADGLIRVRMRVQETLVGAMDVGARVEILLPAYVVCPPQPRFVEGETRVVAFSRPDAAGRRHLCGLFATKLDDLRHELRSVRPYLAESDPAKRKARQLAWVVERLANSRDDGRSALEHLASWSRPALADEYAAKGDAAAHRWLDTAPAPVDLARDLTPGQRVAAENALERVERTGWGTECVARVRERLAARRESGGQQKPSASGIRSSALPDQPTGR